MTLREQIIAEALSWRNTPYHHQACVKGVGVDCAMLLIGIGKACGLLAPEWQPPLYSPQWHLHQNEEMLRETLAALGCVERPREAMLPGDILLMQYGHVSSHSAILVDDPPPYIVHASLTDRRVIHHRFDSSLHRRLRHVYAFPGVEP